MISNIELIYSNDFISYLRVFERILKINKHGDIIINIYLTDLNVTYSIY